MYKVYLIIIRFIELGSMSATDSFNIGYEESLHIVTPINNPFNSQINHHHNGKTN
jgi:hypothetical protein